MPPANQPGRLPELDGLRGLLSLWVALAHILCWTGFLEFKPPWGLRWAWSQFITAEAAVETFIILSGFAISFLLQARQQNYSQFMRGRFFRIYPVYLVCLGLGVAVATLTPFVLDSAAWNTVYFDWNRSISGSERSAPTAHLAWHLTLLQGIVPHRLLANSTATFLAPAWSVSLEWQYYLFALIVARLVRSGRGVLLLAALGWVGLRCVHLFANPHNAFLPSQLPLFLIGIGSYHFYAGSDKPHTTLFIAGLIAVAALTSWHAVAIIIWAVAFGSSIAGRGVIHGVLMNRLLQRLGMISYSLYLVHWPLIIALLAALIWWHPDATSNEAVTFLMFPGLLVILVAAGLLTKFVERPMIAMGKKSVRVSSNATAASVQGGT